MHRVLVVAAWAAGMLALALALWQGWSMTLRTEGIPSYDAADYMNRALEILRPGSGWGAVVKPDVHPPGYPVALAGWMGISGRSFLAAAQLSALLTAASLALLVVLGGLVGGPGGRLAGLGAAVATAMSIEHQRLLAAPMTEPLALLAAVGFLVLAVLALERRSAAIDLAVGLALLGATLVRYNLGPMLLLPLVLVHGHLVVRHPRRALDWRLVLWVLPTAVLLGVWWLAEPRLDDSIRTFAVNVDTGIRTWSWENLVWLPASFTRDYAGLAPAAVAAGLAFVLASGWAFVPRRLTGPEGSRRGLQLVILFAVIGIAAVWLHPFKLSRALHPLVPMAYLVAAVGVARASTRWGGWVRAVSLVAVLGLGSWWYLSSRSMLAEPDAHGRLELVQIPDVEEDLDALVQVAAGRSRVTVSGEHLLVSTVAVEALVRLVSPRAHVTSEHKPPDWCGPPGQSQRHECLPSPASRQLLASGGQSPDWLVITVEKTARGPGGGPGRGGHWSQHNAASMATAAAAMGVPVLAEVRSGRRRVRVTALGWPTPR